jgi:hypothetical protein
MLYRGLRTLNKLNTIEEVKKMAAAKVTVSTSDFNFPEIPLNPIKIKAF